MASCINKDFTVIYIRKCSGEINSSNSMWSLNSAELNRTCTVVVNIITILPTDFLCRFNYHKSNCDTKYLIKAFTLQIILLYFMKMIKLIGSSK